MRYLILLLMSCAAEANISCFSYGTITSCNNGVSLYEFGNMTQIVMPNQNTMTMYKYDNGASIIVPGTTAPITSPEKVLDIPLLPPLPYSPVSD